MSSSSNSNSGTSTSSSMTFHDRLVLYTHTCERRYCVHFITFRSESSSACACVCVCTRLGMLKQTHAYTRIWNVLIIKTLPGNIVWMFVDMFSYAFMLNAWNYHQYTLGVVTFILIFLFHSLSAFRFFSLSWIYYHDYYCYMLFRLRCRRRRRHFVVVAVDDAAAVVAVAVVAAAAAVLYIVHRLRYAL